MSWAVERKNDLAVGSTQNMSLGISISGVLIIFKKKQVSPEVLLIAQSVSSPIGAVSMAKIFLY
jgi:hypothetical protein